MLSKFRRAITLFRSAATTDSSRPILDLTLRELGVDTLIAFGCDTNICVLQTLAGAYFRGYKTVVPADACGTFLVGTQEQGLEYFTRCYDSRVVDTDSVIACLS